MGSVQLAPVVEGPDQGAHAPRAHPRASIGTCSTQHAAPFRDLRHGAGAAARGAAFESDVLYPPPPQRAIAATATATTCSGLAADAAQALRPAAARAGRADAAGIKCVIAGEGAELDRAGRSCAVSLELERPRRVRRPPRRSRAARPPRALPRRGVSAVRRGLRLRHRRGVRVRQGGDHLPRQRRARRARARRRERARRASRRRRRWRVAMRRLMDDRSRAPSGWAQAGARRRGRRLTLGRDTIGSSCSSVQAVTAAAGARLVVTPWLTARRSKRASPRSHQGDHRLQPDRGRRPRHGRPVGRQGQLGAAADPRRAARSARRSTSRWSPSTSTPATRTTSTT